MTNNLYHNFIILVYEYPIKHNKLFFFHFMACISIGTVLNIIYAQSKIL